MGGLFHGINTIAKLEGPGGLYRGLGPTILKQGSNQAVRFLVYNDSKKLLDNYIHPTAATMISGGFAGFCSVYANTPVDVVKTNMQGEAAKNFNGPVDCAKQ